MRIEARYKAIGALKNQILENPKKYKESLRAAQLALSLLQEILSRLEKGQDPNLSTSIQWMLPLESIDDPEGLMRLYNPQYRITADLALHTIEAFMQLTAFRGTKTRKISKHTLHELSGEKPDDDLEGLAKELEP